MTTLAAFGLADVLVRRSTTWARMIAATVAAGFVVATVRYWALAALISQVGAGSYTGRFRAFFTALPFSVVLFGALTSVGFTAEYVRRMRRQSEEAARLRVEVAEANLRALRLQLNPHFLYNALNSIATLMHRDLGTADRAVVALGRILRAVLAEAPRQEVALADELATLDAYLELEQLRFGEWLTVSVEASGEALGVAVPPLLLQPLVENAIRHGIAPRGGPGRLSVTAHVAGAEAVIAVRDDGVGLTAPGEGGAAAGIGLANTRARLRHMYGGAAALTVRPATGGGTVVEVRLPARPAGAAPAGAPSPAPQPFRVFAGAARAHR